MEKLVCLTIAGSDSGGGAGIQADLKTFASIGVHGVSVLTSVTAQNTQRVEAIFDLPPDFIKKQLDALHRDFKISAAKTGMLSSPEIIKIVAESVGNYPLVVDPVMVATSGDRLQGEGAVNALKEHLLPKATVVTPNIEEAEVLSGIEIKTLEDARAAAERIAELAEAVVVKGGHLNATDVLYYRGKLYEFTSPKLDGKFHGSGCTYSAALAALLAKGLNLPEAVEQAKKFINSVLRAAYKPGRGARVLDHAFPLHREAKRYRVLKALGDAVQEIVRLPGFVDLIPEVGVNFVYALPYPEDISDVAGIEGRIVKAGKRAIVAGCIDFGASGHVARVVIAASRRDPRVRSAINVRFSEKVVAAIESAGLSCASFSREDEPPGASTMEWGTLKAIESFGRVPDAIYDRGAQGKEPMVRILGETPQQIVEKLRQLLEHLY